MTLRQIPSGHTCCILLLFWSSDSAPGDPGIYSITASIGLHRNALTFADGNRCSSAPTHTSLILRFFLRRPSHKVFCSSKPTSGGLGGRRCELLGRATRRHCHDREGSRHCGTPDVNSWSSSLSRGSAENAARTFMLFEHLKTNPCGGGLQFLQKENNSTVT